MFYELNNFLLQRTNQEHQNKGNSEEYHVPTADKTARHTSNLVAHFQQTHSALYNYLCSFSKHLAQDFIPQIAEDLLVLLRDALVDCYQCHSPDQRQTICAKLRAIHQLVFVVNINNTCKGNADKDVQLFAKNFKGNVSFTKCRTRNLH